MAAESDEEKLFRHFQTLDQNGDGTISKSELLGVLQRLDAATWNDEKVERVLQTADLKGDSVIHFDEFVTWASIEGQDQRDFAKTMSRDPAEAVVNTLVRSVSNHSTESGTATPSITAALEELHAAEWEKKQPAIVTLLKLLNNIAKNPDNPKFRHIKRTNAALAAKVFSVKGCAEFLLAAGFKEEGEEFVLPDGVDISWILDEFNAFGNEELQAQMRAERDAKIAAVKAAEQETAKFKLAGLPGGSSDDEERKRTLALMEADKKERECRDKLAAEGFRLFEGIPAMKAGGDVNNFASIGVDLNKGGG